MSGSQRPPRHVLVAGVFLAVAVGVFITYGVAGLLVLAVASLFTGSYLANRHVVIPLDGRYPRHGDQMD